MKKYIFLVLIFVLFGCYSDTINKLETFSIQIPLLFAGPFENRTAPDTSYDFTNLHKYPEYRDNKDRVNKAEILQLNYLIDSLVYDDGTVFDPKTDDLEFYHIRYTLRFAKPLTGNEQSTNPDDFIPDDSLDEILLGEFKDVKIKDYYREAKHILEVPEESAKAISDMLKIKPYFYLYTEYSKVKGQTEEYIKFKIIKAKFDLILRLEVKL